MPTTPPIRIPIIGDDRFTKKFKNITRNIKRVSRGLTSAGQSMTRFVTMPLLLAGGAAAKVGADFDFMMRKVEAKVTITGKSIGELRTQAKELGRTTVHTAREVAGAQEKLAMAGWDSLEVFTALPSVLALSTATSTELIQTADIASNVMQQFGLKTEDTARVADVFATIVSGTNVDMEMLAETMKMSGTVARDYGMSLEDTAAAAGFLGNMGIQGSMAGTTMARMMDKLVSPTGKAARMLKKMGVEISDKKTGKIKDLSVTLGDLAKGMGELGQDKRMKALSEIFGIRGKRGASPLIRDAMALDSTFEMLSKTMDNMKPGKAQKMVDIMTAGATGSFKRFTSALEGVAIAFAESGLLDSLAKMAEYMAKVFQKIAELNPETKKMILKFAMFAAAMGPVLLIAGQVVAAIGGIIGIVAAAGGLAALAALALPLLKVALVVGLVVAAIALLWDELEPLRTMITEGLKSAWDELLPVMMDVWDIIKSVGSVAKDLAKIVMPVVAWFIKWGVRIVAFLSGFYALKIALKIGIKVIKVLARVVKFLAKTISEWLVPKMKIASEWIDKWKDKLLDLLSPLEGVWEWVSKIGSDISNWADDFLGDEEPAIKKVKFEPVGDIWGDPNMSMGEGRAEDDSMFGLGEGMSFMKGINLKQEAEVNIKFSGLPKGATVETSGNVKTSSDTGPLMGSPL